MLQLVDHAHTSSAVTFVEFVVDVLLRRGLVSRLLNYLAPWFLQEGLGLITWPERTSKTLLATIEKCLFLKLIAISTSNWAEKRLWVWHNYRVKKPASTVGFLL